MKRSVVAKDWGKGRMNKQNLEKLSEKAVASHSSTLAWNIPWTEEPGRLHHGIAES